MSEEDIILVVHLPDPEPVAARNDRGPAVPTVPDDIVREISTLLDFKDRLALSLTSHHMYEVVQPHVEEAAVKDSQVPALHRRMFENTVVRASRLRVLHIDLAVATNTNMDSAVVMCFLDIIGQATKLDSLRCTGLLSEALRTRHLAPLTNLRYLQLRGFTSKMMESLHLPITLTELHLSHPPLEMHFNLRRILRSISYLQALTMLTLEGVMLPDSEDSEEGDDSDGDDSPDEDDDEDAVEDEDEDADEHEDADEEEDQDADEDENQDDSHGEKPTEASTTAAPVLASVHTLRLLDMEVPPGVDWATAFPALKTLVLIDCIHLDDANAYATKPLQHLIVSGSFESYPVPWRVNWLTYDPGVASPEGILGLDDVCDASELVVLSFELLFMTSLVWDAVINTASDVRLLEIACHGTELPEVIWFFYELFSPNSAIDVPLICLSIVAAAAPTQAPEDREENRNGFLDRTFKALPTLRYVALAEPSGDRQGNLVPKDDYAGNASPWRWWRVVCDDDGSPIEIREIPGWEGERVRGYLRNADWEAADHFGDRFVALR